MAVGSSVIIAVVPREPVHVPRHGTKRVKKKDGRRKRREESDFVGGRGVKE